MKKQEGWSVLVTACTLSPVGVDTLLSLKKYVSHIVGVDIHDSDLPKYLGISYHKVPEASDKKYVDTILEIALEENVSIIFPLTTEETLALKDQEKRFTEKNIVIANPNSADTIRICNNKFSTLEALHNKSVAVPNYIMPRNIEELERSVIQLGYPQKEIAFKPCISRGSRGFRIISQTFDQSRILLQEKPTENIFITLEELIKVLKTEKIFPQIILMDYLQGDDFSVYCLAHEGETLSVIPMKRSGLLPGMSTGGEIIKDESIISYAQQVISALGLSGSINIQLKKRIQPLLYEINPRISATTVITSGTGLNYPYLNLLITKNNISEARRICQTPIQWGTKLFRIHRELLLKPNGTFEEL